MPGSGRGRWTSEGRTVKSAKYARPGSQLCTHGRRALCLNQKQTIARAMTTDQSSRQPAAQTGVSEVQALQRRRAWALAAATRAAIRIVAPTLPKTPRVAAPVTPLRVAPPVVAAAPKATKAVAPTADAQAPARDALTGAYTQQHFVAATDREWARIRRHGEDAALLMVDVDHFQRLNDEHGTPAGDAMLVEITRLASSTLRPYDLLARFGGGVLLIYLPHKIGRGPC